MSAAEPTSPCGGEARFQLPDTVRRTARQKIAVLIDYHDHGLGVLPE